MCCVYIFYCLQPLAAAVEGGEPIDTVALLGPRGTIFCWRAAVVVRFVPLKNGPFFVQYGSRGVVSFREGGWLFDVVDKLIIIGIITAFLQHNNMIVKTSMLYCTWFFVSTNKKREYRNVVVCIM